MVYRTAQASWDGDFSSGVGRIILGDKTEVRYSAFTRFSLQKELTSNPEELLGGALAGCYSMTLTNELSEAGYRPLSVDCDVSINLEQTDSGFAIAAAMLTCRATVPGIEDDEFDIIARQAAEACLVAKALKAVVIHYDVVLVRGAPAYAA